MKPQEAGPLPSRPARSLIGGIFQDTFNQGNFASLEEHLTPESITHITVWGMAKNRMGFKQWVASLRTAFPDLYCTVDDEIWQGEKFAAHWTLRGTHRGYLFGNPPTGRPVVVQGIIFARTENGRIVEDWMLVDQLSLLQQLGLVPPPTGR